MTDLFVFGLTMLLKITALWFLVTALLFWKRPPVYPRRNPRTRFACLIPARNEEAVIGELVGCLKAQDYPPELFDVYVVPNNCTDDTAGAALRAGAKVLTCDQPVRYKGDALRQSLGKLMNEGYDAFCVFDADNLVKPDYLSHMNDAFCAGARLAKARLTTRNTFDSWVAGCYTLYFAIFDRFFNRSRAQMGLSAKLVGTGFAVHRDVLVKMGGWMTESIAEDAEFAAMCAEMGERVWWVPEAVTYDEAPTGFRLSLIQRRRWCSGIMSAATLRLLPLVQSFRQGGGTEVTLRRVDSLMFLCSPFFQALSLIPMVLLMGRAAVNGTILTWLMVFGASLGASALGLMGFGTLLAAWIGIRDRRIVKSILGFPLFMACWMPLMLLSLLHRTTEWKAIAHRGARAGVTNGNGAVSALK